MQTMPKMAMQPRTMAPGMRKTRKTQPAHPRKMRKQAMPEMAMQPQTMAPGMRKTRKTQPAQPTRSRKRRPRPAAARTSAICSSPMPTARSVQTATMWAPAARAAWQRWTRLTLSPLQERKNWFAPPAPPSARMAMSTIVARSARLTFPSAALWKTIRPWSIPMSSMWKASGRMPGHRALRKART